MRYSKSSYVRIILGIWVENFNLLTFSFLAHHK